MAKPRSGGADSPAPGEAYFFARTLEESDFASALTRAEDALKKEGFGVLTRIDVRATMKEKLGEDVPAQVILGACNPALAHRALQAEPHIGLMLPCNVTVRALAPGSVEIAAVDPVASMQAIDNPALAGVAQAVRGKLRAVIDGL